MQTCHHNRGGALVLSRNSEIYHHNEHTGISHTADAAAPVVVDAVADDDEGPATNNLHRNTLG